MPCRAIGTLITIAESGNRPHERHAVTTGFYSAASRAAGQLTPDDAVVYAVDATRLPQLQNTLHPKLDFGCFDLWPSLTGALHELAREIELRGVPEEHEPPRPWAQACEHGALLFLRSVLLSERSTLGLPLFEWPVGMTPQTCQRFGEAFAAFAHTDLRVAERPMYNLWVPVANVDSEPLLLFAAGPNVDELVDWRAARDRAHHLPIEGAGEGDWYHWPQLPVGRAIIFPGDGGGHCPGAPGIFHCSAWASLGTRLSFDVRELVVPHRPGESSSIEQAVQEARERLARHVTEWESGLQKLEKAAPHALRETLSKA